MGSDRWLGSGVFIYRNPADRCAYVFCNKGRDKLKLLIWLRTLTYTLHL